MWADVCDLCLADLGEHPPPGRPGSDVVLPGVIEQIRFADLPALRALIDLAESRYAASR